MQYTVNENVVRHIGLSKGHCGGETAGIKDVFVAVLIGSRLPKGHPLERLSPPR